jgi:hypothetical protein
MGGQFFVHNLSFHYRHAMRHRMFIIDRGGVASIKGLSRRSGYG